jgi:carbamate kinase
MQMVIALGGKALLRRGAPPAAGTLVRLRARPIAGMRPGRPK